MRPCALAILLLAALQLAPAETQAITWYVTPDGTGDAPTIQAAVDAASAGDEVLVAAGTYPDHSTRSVWSLLSACLFMKAGVAVRSENGPEVTIIDPGGAAKIGVVFYVATDAEFTGFTVRGTTHERVFLASSGSAVIRDNHFLGVGLSPSLRCFSSSPLVHNNYFDGRGMNFDGSPATVTDNVVDGSDAAFAHGVKWVEASDGIIAGNLFIECKDAGALLTKASPPVVGNTIVACRNGILTNRANLEIRRNIIIDSWQIGIFTDDVVGEPIVECNDVWNSANGNNYVGEVADLTGSAGNISAPPLFCDTNAGNFQLQWGSPCLAENSTGCGQIGAFGFGACNSVSVTPETWGRVKARFRAP